MAWVDLHEHVLAEFADSSAMVQLALDFEDRWWMHVDGLAWADFGRSAAPGCFQKAKRNAARRKLRHPRRPKWNRGLSAVDPTEARTRRNERRRAWYAQRSEASREKARARARAWWQRNRDAENAKDRAEYAARKEAA